MNLDSPLSGQEMDDGMTDITLYQDLSQQDGEHLIADENVENTDDSNEVVDSKRDSCLDSTTVLPANEQNGTSETFCEKVGLTFVDDKGNSGVQQEAVSEGHLLAQFGNKMVCDVRDDINLVCASTLEHPKLGEVNDNSELKVGFSRSNDGPVKNIVTETEQKTSEDNLLPCGVSDSLISTEQPLQYFPTFSATSDKVWRNCCWIFLPSGLQLIESLGSFSATNKMIITSVFCPTSFRLFSYLKSILYVTFVMGFLLKMLTHSCPVVD
jgi:hypothetical protein